MVCIANRGSEQWSQRRVTDGRVMDELTKERYGPGVPWGEQMQPGPKPPPKVRALTREEIRAHRLILCGTADTSMPDKGWTW